MGKDNIITTRDMDTLATYFSDYSGYIDNVNKELANMQTAMASMYEGKAKEKLASEFDKLIAHYKVLKDSSDTMNSFVSTYKTYMVAADDNQKNRVDETLDIQQLPC